MNKDQIELLGDNHVSSGVETPLLPNAFDKSDEEKIANIQMHFAAIMEELGMDLKDDRVLVSMFWTER